MPHPIPLTDDISWVGVNDRQTDLFEGIWPLPNGVSYNSYLIADEKIVLVDTVKRFFIDEYLDLLDRALPPGRPVDVLIINHLEPDHSGSIKVLRRLFPNMQIVGSAKTVEFIQHLYGITVNVRTVNDGDQLSSGKHKLHFLMTPMVHWPETMMTYDDSSRTLFSGDGFGAFGAIDGAIFDDQIDVNALDDEILRYFSNIIGKYCVMVQRALKKLESTDIKILATTHGPVWRTNPRSIIARYDTFSRQEGELGLTIAWGSMYGNTESMARAVAAGAAAEGLKTIRFHDVSRTHPSYILRDAWRFRALVLGSPTYDSKLYEPMENLVTLFRNKTLKNKLIGIFGTFGWTGGGVKALQEFAAQESFTLADPIVEARFHPTDDHLDQCRQLGQNIARTLTT